MREYSNIEKLNIEFLNRKGVKHAEILFTANILYHGIFDATRPIKNFLKESNVHDFDQQNPGEKKSVVTHLLTYNEEIVCQASLYRSVTRGDRRMWFGSDTYTIVEEDEVCSMFCLNNELFVINISTLDLEVCCNSVKSNPIKKAVIGK